MSPRVPLLTLAALLALQAGSCEHTSDKRDDDDTREDTTLDASADTSALIACGACTDPARPLCATATATCVECLRDSDCDSSPNGELCVRGLCIVPQCERDDECSSSERCHEARCIHDVIACETELDCPALRPACIAGTSGGQCESFERCNDDDDDEPHNDGPNGAPRLALAAGSRILVQGRAICSAPQAEADWFAVELATGDHLRAVLTAEDPSADLDLEIIGPDLVSVGMSWWHQPEVVELTYLPAGTYYLVVRQYSGDVLQTEATRYTLAVERTASEGCSSSADCAEAHATQFLRGECEASGACVPIRTPVLARGPGEPCDSADDCRTDLCTYDIAIRTPTAPIIFNFIADAHERAFCSNGCSSDLQCAEGQLCSLATSTCILPCTRNAHCPVILDWAPTPGEPWRHLTCDEASGDCLAVHPTLGEATARAATTRLEVDGLISHGPGWLVVRDEAQNLLGHSRVRSGINGLEGPIVVRLARTLVASERLLVALHHDLAQADVFEPEADPAALDAQGMPVVRSVTVSP